MNDRVQIRGGVGPLEAAAIMAAIQQLLDEEAASQAMITPRNVPSPWVRTAWRRIVQPTRTTTTALSPFGFDSF